MATMAAEPSVEGRTEAARRAAARVGTSILVLAALWGLWEGYRWLWIHEGWTWPFTVNDTTMPHLHDIFAALWGRASPGGVGPRLITVLVKGALFTARKPQPDSRSGRSSASRWASCSHTSVSYSEVCCRGSSPRR